MLYDRASQNYLQNTNIYTICDYSLTSDNYTGTCDIKYIN